MMTMAMVILLAVDIGNVVAEVDDHVESETEPSETERGSVKRGPEPVPSKSSKHAKK